MKRLIILLLIPACAPPKFVVTAKYFTPLDGVCIVRVRPINDRAAECFADIDSIIVRCEDYFRGDTLVLTKREFKFK